MAMKPFAFHGFRRRFRRQPFFSLYLVGVFIFICLQSLSWFLKKPFSNYRIGIRSRKNKKSLTDIDAGLTFYSIVREVPSNTNRYSFPWRLPKQARTIDYADSHGRILYTPLRQISPEGLGHALATNNADLTTAWRLGLTYTHRIAKFGSLTKLSPDDNEIYRTELLGHKEQAYFRSGSAVENFFGWGSGEIPREAITRIICPKRKWNMLEKECIFCDAGDLKERKYEMRREKNGPMGHVNEVRVEQVVVLPENLTYSWPSNPSEDLLQFRLRFLKSNNLPYTVFVMPPVKCLLNPTFSKFRERSYAHYYTKYWDTHSTENEDNFFNVSYDLHEKGEFSSFEDYHDWATNGFRLPMAVRRPELRRIKENKVNIAIHARRGDFFKVGRPMVSARAFACITSEIISLIRYERSSIFSEMPISIAIYSEGEPKGKTTSIGHDISRMDSKFVDVDGAYIDETTFKMLLQEEIGKHGERHDSSVDLHVNMRISENTVLCLHEMISSDVFIGSESGMSKQLLGSLSRGAMQILPVVDPESSDTQIQFNGITGEIQKSVLLKARDLWRLYVKYNEVSTRRAVRDQNKKDPK